MNCDNRKSQKNELIHLAWILPLGVIVVILMNIAAHYAVTAFIGNRPEEEISEEQYVTVNDPNAVRLVLPAEGMTVEDDFEAAFAEGTTVLNGSDIKSAEATYNEGQYSVTLEFTETGAEKFAKITEENVGNYLGIFVENELVSFPVINEKITEGTVVMSGGFTREEVNEIADLINQNIQNTYE